MEAGEVKTLGLIIKSDVQGSLEALRSAFEKLEHPELEVRIHAGVGPVNESDVRRRGVGRDHHRLQCSSGEEGEGAAGAAGVDVKLYRSTMLWMT